MEKNKKLEDYVVSTVKEMLDAKKFKECIYVFSAYKSMGYDIRPVLDYWKKYQGV